MLSLIYIVGSATVSISVGTYFGVRTCVRRVRKYLDCKVQELLDGVAKSTSNAVECIEQQSSCLHTSLVDNTESVCSELENLRTDVQEQTKKHEHHSTLHTTALGEAADKIGAEARAFKERSVVLLNQHPDTTHFPTARVAPCSKCLKPSHTYSVKEGKIVCHDCEKAGN